MGKLKPRAGGKALTGGNVKFSDEFIKNLPGMDGKFDSGPKGSQTWDELINLPKAQLKRMTKQELLAYMRKRSKKA
tara:strand:- start:157 stop:384 length:228 start_codon:yes stop_codon:yes gene_type:complete